MNFWHHIDFYWQYNSRLWKTGLLKLILWPCGPIFSSYLFLFLNSHILISDNLKKFAVIKLDTRGFPVHLFLLGSNLWIKKRHDKLYFKTLSLINFENFKQCSQNYNIGYKRRNFLITFRFVIQLWKGTYFVMRLKW